VARATAGTTVSDAARAARAAWTERNPLRAWRLRHKPKLTILEAAGELGVGMSMVQMYEKGVHKPGPSKDEVLTRLLGSDWSEKWDAWLAKRPADR
jgi:transcriptional regulator with XRE-family HTH domain